MTEQMQPTKEQQQTMALASARLRLEKQNAMTADTESRQADKVIAREITAPFNKGLIELASAPMDLVNAGLRVVQWGDDKPYQLPNGLREWGQHLNMTAAPGQESTSGVARASELLGMAVLPEAAMIKKGQMLLKELPVVLKYAKEPGVVITAMREMWKTMASNPGATAALDVASSSTAAAGGKIAEQVTDNQTAILMSELSAGFAPAAAIAGVKAIPKVVAENMKWVGSMWDNISKNLLPFMSGGAEVRAANRLQGLSPDPIAEAAQISTVPNRLSPARQTGNPKLIALEKKILSLNPAKEKAYNEGLEAAKKELESLALSFGGSDDRVRDLLRSGQVYLENLVDIRAAQAAEALDTAVANLRPDATIRQISRVAREQIGAAYDDVTSQEAALWAALDSTTPVSPSNGKEALARILSTRSKTDDPADIPQYVYRWLSSRIPDDAKVALGKAGMLNPDGTVPENLIEPLTRQGVIPSEEFTFNDIKSLRSRILSDIRNEGGRTDGIKNRNKIRILNEIANGNPETGAKGLLDDLGEAGVEGYDAARGFSSQLNKKFRTGQVGKILGFDSTGELKTDPADVLDQLLTGKRAMTNVSKFIEASPESAPIVEQYIVEKFFKQVLRDGKIAKRPFDSFMNTWEDRGLFEVYPHLKERFTRISGLSGKLLEAEMNDKLVKTWKFHSGQEAAKMYLEAAPGEEMSRLLTLKRPEDYAAKIYTEMRGDEEAIKGLKTSFVEELLNRSKVSVKGSDGLATDSISGNKFEKLLTQYKSTAKALGVDDEELSRLSSIAEQLKKAEINPTDLPSGVLTDKPMFMLELLARYLGAKEGGKMSKTMGGSLVLASALSKRMVYLLNRLTGATAEKMLISAAEDPILYKALMTRVSAPQLKQDKSADILQAWMLAVGAIDSQDVQPPEEEPK